MKNEVKQTHSSRWIPCPEEEYYLGRDLKASRKERKRASATDRSKYKETDRKKEKKQKALTTKIQVGKRGRALSITSQGIIVEGEDKKQILCFLRGALKKERSQWKNLVAVGDWVKYELNDDTTGTLLNVEPRYSILSRADTLDQRKVQIIAANMDQTLITMSVVKPTLKPFLIDRYIIASSKGGIRPIVLINKMDLLEDEQISEEIRNNECELLQQAINAYNADGIPVICLSAFQGQGLEALREIMKDKMSVFSGPSGAGKSSLINAIAGMNLPVGEVVAKTKKGTHTTTLARLYPLEFGGWCMDTPGVKSFGLWDLKKDEVVAYFTQIFLHGQQCRFANCTHRNENGCAVRVAVETGLIPHLRYQSYLALLENLDEEHLRR